MKVAYHFLCPSEYDGNYVDNSLSEIFKIIFEEDLNIASKIYVGDILLIYSSYETVNETEFEQRMQFNKVKYDDLVVRFIEESSQGWTRLGDDFALSIYGENFFAISFETLDVESAEIINEKLSNVGNYLGAFEINDNSRLHWVMYSNLLILKYRIKGKRLYLFWDNMFGDGGDKDTGMAAHWQTYGFSKVEFESLNGKRTIFDEYHNFEHAQFLAKWRKHASGLLASVADSIVYHLEDAAPKIGEKLWGAIKAFSKAETQEDFAHAALSCRRIIEYVADQIYPPVPNGGDGQFKLGKSQHRNRLLAFADESKKSETNIELILVSTKMLSEQLEKIQNLQNKGLHDNLLRSEVRRCLLRTFLIIDDIVSLREEPLPVKTKLANPFTEI